MNKDLKDQVLGWGLVAGQLVAGGAVAVMAALAFQAALWASKGNEPPCAPPVEKTPLVEQFKGACDGQVRIEQQARQLNLVLPKGCSLKPS